MRKIIIYIVAVTSILRPFVGQAQEEFKENWQMECANAIAAVVEDQIITLEEVRHEMEPIIPQIRRESSSQEEFNRRVAEVGREVLQGLVDRILIIREFNNKGYQIPKAYLEHEYDELVTRGFDGDRTEFLHHLHAHGKTVRDFKQNLKESIIVNYMRGQMRKSQSEISPEKIEEFYLENKNRFYQEESVLLRQIMLSTSSDKEELQKKTTLIMEKLDQGISFADLARKYSEDDKGREGGEWGWISRSDIRKELGDIAFSMEKGHWSAPIELDGHVFILYVEDKREKGVQSLDEVRDQIEYAIIGMLARQSQQRWLEKLRRNAYVKYYL